MEILGEINLATLLSHNNQLISSTTTNNYIVSVVPSVLYQSLSPRKSLIEILINTLGDASAKAQGLSVPVTTLLKLQTSADISNDGCAHRLYIASNGNKALGFIKAGRKQLFLSVPAYVRDGKSRSIKRCEMFTNEIMSTNISSSVSPRIVGRGSGSSSSGIINQEISPLCVLDFFVHSSVRRSGIGRILFDHMILEEAILFQNGRGGGGARSDEIIQIINSASNSSSYFIMNPARFGYDRPSPLFLSFLKKHFGLESATPQPYSMLVFDDYFAEKDLIIVQRPCTTTVFEKETSSDEISETLKTVSLSTISQSQHSPTAAIISSPNIVSASRSGIATSIPAVPTPKSLQSLSSSTSSTTTTTTPLAFSSFRPPINTVTSPSLTYSSPYTSTSNAPSGIQSVSDKNSSQTKLNFQTNQPTQDKDQDGEKSTVDVMRGMTLNPNRYHGQTHLATSSSSEYAFSPSSLSLASASAASQSLLFQPRDSPLPSDVPHAFGQGRSPLRTSVNTRIGTDNSSRGVSQLLSGISYTNETQEIEEGGSLSAAVRRNARLFGRSPQK